MAGSAGGRRSAAADTGWVLVRGAAGGLIGATLYFGLTAAGPLALPAAVPEPAAALAFGAAVSAPLPDRAAEPAVTTPTDLGPGTPLDGPRIPSGPPLASTSPAGLTAAQPDERAGIAVRTALAQRGLPYVWGGDGPGAGDAGFDCSGLTTFAYRAAGIVLPRTAHTQFAAGPRVSPGSPLQPGDLVFYGTLARVHHVGMYVGGGVMVNAPTFGQPIRTASHRWVGDDYLGATRPAATGTAGPVPVPEPAPLLVPGPPPVFAAPEVPLPPALEPPLDPGRSPGGGPGDPAARLAALEATRMAPVAPPASAPGAAPDPLAAPPAVAPPSLPTTGVAAPPASTVPTPTPATPTPATPAPAPSTPHTPTPTPTPTTPSLASSAPTSAPEPAADRLVLTLAGRTVDLPARPRVLPPAAVGWTTVDSVPVARVTRAQASGVEVGAAVTAVTGDTAPRSLVVQEIATVARADLAGVVGRVPTGGLVVVAPAGEWWTVLTIGPG